MPLRRPTADKALLVGAALAGLSYIFRPGFKYAKAGVILLDLQSDSLIQQELDLEADDTHDRSQLMAALDTVNRHYGCGTLKMASAGPDGELRVWSMKQERRTPRYTTRWEDMLLAKA
jgi:DNA polymerase V